MADFTISQTLQNFLPMIKIFGYVVLGLIITGVGVYLIILSKRRKWKVEVHEQKADGKVYSVSRDVLYEKKIDFGKKTIYWLRKAKQEAIPPPDECVDRIKGRDEVDYLRFERDLVPVIKSANTDYSDPRVKKVLTTHADKILSDVRNTKTSLFDSSAVRQRFIYIPIRKALIANINFKPIDYDLSMMAMNQISNADTFYAAKGEFWKKWGFAILFVLTVIFLIILCVLTYEYQTDNIVKVIQFARDAVNVCQSGGVQVPPPS